MNDNRSLFANFLGRLLYYRLFLYMTCVLISGAIADKVYECCIADNIYLHIVFLKFFFAVSLNAMRVSIKELCNLSLLFVYSVE